MPLSDVQRDILAEVVERFLRAWEPSSRKALILKFEDPDAIDELSRRNLLKSSDNIGFLPTALSFHYCRDAEAEALAKRSVETIARIFRKQYRDDKPNFTVAGLDGSIKEFYHAPDRALVLRMGLYLAPYFNLMTSWRGGDANQPDIVPVAISERVVTLNDQKIGALWDTYVKQNVPWPVQDSVGGVVSRQGVPFGLGEEVDIDDVPNILTLPNNSRKVFVVHGHDDAMTQSVARFLERLDLEAVILHEQPSKGRTVIEKFEAHSDVGFAVVLLTPDDECRSNAGLQKRARQNVILELGYFIGRLTRARVCPLYVEGVEIPSDIHGVVYVPFDEGGGWRLKLAKEISAAGIEVDLNRAI